MRKPLVTLAAIFISAVAGIFSARGATTQAELLLSAETARPGETITAGIHLVMQPKWHTYWRNAGEVGYASSVKWTLPPGVTTGEIQWPVPQKSVDANITDYIYNREVVLLVPVTLASNLPAGPLAIKADISWLECDINSACIPGSATKDASLNIGESSTASASAPLIETWRKKLPRDGASLNAKAWWEKPAAGDLRSLIFEWSASNAPAVGDFYTYDSQKYTFQPQTEIVTAPTGRVRLTTHVKKTSGDWPTQVAGLLVEKTETGTTAYDVNLPVQVQETAAATSAVADAPGLVQSSNAGGLLQMLLAAFLGGLILNVMPCVLPVIALKVLSFVKQSGQSAAQARKLGLIYAAGILVSFLGLAALIIGVKSINHAASWGMLFQYPRVVLGMTVLIMLVALNLFGIFEVNLSGGAMQGAGNLAAKEGAPGAFFNGFLAVVLATPCTAAFLGPALGFALTQSYSIIVLFFLTVGAGLAAPYVVLCWQPRWLVFLPKPGAWMERFRNIMGFPMLATAIWLFTVTAPNYGANGDLWLGLFLVMIALAAWVWGQFVQRGRVHKGLAMVVSVVILAGAYGYILEKQLDWRHPVVATGNESKLSDAPAGIDWQPWSPEAVQAARASGRAVLVDFTAKWCLTCQINVKPALESSAVRSKLAALNAVALLEDSFTKNATVVAELSRYQQAGVPLVLVYPQSKGEPVVVLPSLTTAGTEHKLLDALDKAAGK